MLREITIRIDEKKYKFFMELMKNLGFVKVIANKELEDEPLTPSQKELAKKYGLVKY